LLNPVRSSVRSRRRQERRAALTAPAADPVRAVGCCIDETLHRERCATGGRARNLCGVPDKPLACLVRSTMRAGAFLPESSPQASALRSVMPVSFIAPALRESDYDSMGARIAGRHTIIANRTAGLVYNRGCFWSPTRRWSRVLSSSLCPCTVAKSGISLFLR